MICPTIWRVVLLIGGVALAGAPAGAQLALPGAAPAAPAGASGSPAKPKRTKRVNPADAGEKTGPSALKDAPGLDSIDGRPLMLNGAKGLIQISGSGDTLQIDRLSLAGEGVSDASQRCVVAIVGDKPIVATSAGHPDGLARYEVDVPACPFAFDVVNGAVLVPAQITACVFKAADCQTSPSGLWGPDGTTLQADAAAIGKRRTEAENAMARALHKLEDLARDHPDAASVVRDQGGFPGERDDTCRDYVKEAEHGFCAASVTAARAALLEARLATIAPAKSDKSAGADKPKHKKGKSAEAGGAHPQNPQ
ncbi:hypothetical protein DFR50_103116 [Roseiarcus fermentans]|uniref:Uncharacterized protein n=1 Tax=Roseiarcus fermentans TaxID=1473586 RepID=A0A366FRR6_9HYPH|nr:hypothetical protein [Roseiarcus fermentans]RBP17231.1 hypothetical protein DFR50_103116 [Roseiarcus fermentans]